MSFADKACLVTGAASGIGASVSEALLAVGARVALFDLDGAALQQRLDQFAAQPGRAIAIQGDASSSKDMRNAVEVTAREFGGLDALANIAGVARYGTAPEMDEADWDRVLDTNAKSVFLATKHCVPEMLKRGGGSIVNTASVLALGGLEKTFAYCASKGAIVAMTRAMAIDHAADGIRINCVAPGSVRTGMLRYVVGTWPRETSMKRWRMSAGVIQSGGLLSQTRSLR